MQKGFCNGCLNTLTGDCYKVTFKATDGKINSTCYTTIKIINQDPSVEINADKTTVKTDESFHLTITGTSPDGVDIVW